MEAARILGIDPGLNTTGYAVIEAREGGPKLLEAGIIRSASGRATADMADRLKAAYDGVIGVIDQFGATSLAVEQLYAHYDHPRTAILMAHARGAILLAGAQRGLTVSSYAATQIKKTVTGNGRASKEQIQLAIVREFGLPQMPEPPDVADAIAIALCHYHLHKVPGPRSSVLSEGGLGVNLDALFGEREPSPED